METINPWNNIPLEDYEKHMEHKDVAQSQLLNSLYHMYLQKYNPQYILFLGISGGNGLEHTDTTKVKRICGIDINQSYLDETKSRFGERIEQLELINIDISTTDQSFITSDFIWAALIFEYVDTERALKFIASNAGNFAKLIITIQSNNGAGSVSPTGIESVKKVKDIFKIVNGEDLQNKAAKFGFEMIAFEENVLPNGKSFITYSFEQKSNN